MTGSLQKKGLVYYAVYRDSRGKQKWVNTKCKEKKKAKSILNSIMYELEHGTYIEPQKSIFIDLLVDYYKNSVCHDVEVTTHDGYMSIINNHILPYFQLKDFKLQDIRTIDLQEYFEEKYRQGLRTSTLNRHLPVFKRFFCYAEDMDLIRKNLIIKVRLHRNNDKSIQNCYSIEELNKLFEAVSNDVISPAVVLASRYALRRGELLGLRWQDIDFDKHTIKIVNTRTKVYKAVEKKPKSLTSIKEFYMFEDIEEYLLLLKKNQKEDAEAFGNCYNNNDYVIRYSNGDPISIATLNFRFSKVLKENGLRHIRFHDLRHTVATLMLEDGFYIKIAQAWMRHANPDILMRIYAEISPTTKSEMDTKIENFFTSNINSSLLEKC